MRIASVVLRVGDSLGVRVRPLGQHGHRLQRTPTETGQFVDDVAAGSLSHEKAVALEASQRLGQDLAADPTDRLDQLAVTAGP